MKPPLKRLLIEDFEPLATDYDVIVRGASDLDAFCSSSAWVLPAHAAFAPERPLWVLQSPTGFILFALAVQPGFGVILEPLESVWGLACPFVGRDLDALVEDFLNTYVTVRSGPLPMLVGGVRQGSASERSLMSRLGRRSLILGLPPTGVVKASLDGGIDGFLGRRARKFRANLRRALRGARALDIRFEIPPPPAGLEGAMALYRRVLRVEARSRKGKQGSGLIDPGMASFYRHLIRRTYESGALRFLFARHEGQDVGFLFGVVNDDTFRGLQASFDTRYARISLGNLLHWQAISRLCDEGVRWYDMGVDAPYKHRWGEVVVTYTQFVAV